MIKPALTTLGIVAALSLTPARAGDGDFTDPLAAPLTQDSGRDGWDIQFRPYLWTANLDGTMAINGQSAPVDIGFDDLLDNLDMAWASTLDIRRRGSDWGFLLDTNYIEISPGIDQALGGPLTLRGLRIKQALVDAVLTYRVHRFDDGSWIDILAGLRWQYMKNTIELRNSATDTTPDVSGSKDWIDPHVGVRFKKFLNKKLYVGGFADIGGFEIGSDIAIAGALGLGYHVRENIALEAMVRYLSVDYEDGGFEYDIDTTGLFLGAAFYF